MKKFTALFILLIVFAGMLVVAQGSNSSIGAGDAKKIQDAVGKIPINDSGQFDFNKYQPFKTKADERIEKINSYVGPITKILFGVELSLSWIFVFSVIMWLLLIEIIMMPVKDVFGFNAIMTLIFSTIVASLAMQSFGKNFVVWMNSLAVQWWSALLVILTAIIVGAIYSLIMKYFGVKLKNAKEESEKVKTEQDRKVIHTEAEVAKDDLESR